MDVQLSFLDQVTIKEGAPPTPRSPWDLLAAGLKANRMGQLDRIERLEQASIEQKCLSALKLVLRTL